MYIAPDGSFSALFPGAFRRAAAGAVDWTLAGILFLLASLVGGLFQSLGVLSWNAGDLGGIPGAALVAAGQLVSSAPVVGYFAYYWTTGSTLGMRALDIELVRAGTGRPPRWPRALLRGLLAFVLVAAANNVYLALANGGLAGYSALERAVVEASLVVAGAGLVAKAWLLVDGQRRSLLDRAFGLLYLEERLFSGADPSPWAPYLR